MSRSLTGTVTKRVLSFTSSDVPIVAGNVGEDTITVTFDSEWETLSKVVVFECAGRKIEKSYSAGMVIPWEVLQERGLLYVSFEGFSGTTAVLNTVKMATPLRVECHAPTDGVEDTPATRGIVAECVAATENAQAAADDLDSMTASATQLPSSYQPTANLDRTGSTWELELGIPKGDKGDTGSGIPSGGNDGQILVKDGTESGATRWENPGGTTSVWGGISGTLSNQTDLQSALNAKQDTVSDLATIRSKATSALQPADILDSVASTATDKALSAHQGKELNDRIDNLASRGRFLSTWDCSTGLPATDPAESPYAYRAGDYYLVGNIGTGTHYRPNGSSYTARVASQMVETSTVAANDTYIYDGTQWVLQRNTTQEATFATIAGQPTDNSNLASALAAKQAALVSGTNIKTLNNESLLGSGNIRINGAEWGNITGTLADQSDLTTALAAKADDNAVVHYTGAESISGVKTFQVSPTVPTPTNDTDAATKAYVDAKQDALSQAQMATVNSGLMAADKTKLDGIEAGAEVNVQSDWNAASGDAAILNKPTIRNVPTSTAADAGKFLCVNASGDAAWTTVPAAAGEVF